MSTEASIQREFERFNRDNPQVLESLETLAESWFEQGNSRVAIGMLWEVLRWQSGIDTSTTDLYRLNNNYRSRYVRLMIDRHPEWAERFQVRGLRAA